MTKKNAKILLADDERDVLEFLKYALENESYQVVTASDGMEAIQVAKREQPDVMVLDVMMPKLDGIQACRELRRMPQFKNTIITFLTARDEEAMQIQAFEYGADDFITKPVKPRVFISRIAALLRRNNGHDVSEMLVAGRIEINKERYTVRIDNEEFILPKKEFELLSLFVSKPGKVFKREEILNTIWGYDSEVGERTIDVHMRRLRKKIGEDSFVTIKGVGYKFEA